MIKIYINEKQIDALKDEITFYEFMSSIKEFLKQLLKKPSDIKLPSLLQKIYGNKEDLIKQMKDIGLIKSSEKITEEPVDESKHPYGKKMVAKHYITYKIPRARFKEKLEQLYNDIKETNFLTEDGEGASSCGSVMQGGGSNPSAGQYDVPFKNIQRRDFWYKSLSRKNGKNKSLSINTDE